MGAADDVVAVRKKPVNPVVFRWNRENSLDDLSVTSIVRRSIDAYRRNLLNRLGLATVLGGWLVGWLFGLFVAWWVVR